MGRADIYPVYDQTPADYSTFDRKITLRFALDGYRINGRQGPDAYNSFIGRPQNSIDSCRNQAITTHDSGLAGLGSGGVTGKPDVEKRQLVAELPCFCRANRKRALRGRNHVEG